jgi:hypothetical protein
MEEIPHCQKKIKNQTKENPQEKTAETEKREIFASG